MNRSSALGISRFTGWAIAVAHVFLLLGGVGWTSLQAAADGLMLPDLETWKQLHEKGLWNEPEQKALVFFDNGTEQLLISPRYEGPADKFAWVIPVPSRPKVEIADEAIFHELMGASSSLMAVPPQVNLLERKTVGDYDVSVLSSNDSDALMNWLMKNGYHLPEAAARPLQSYIAKRWTFVACRVSAPGSEGKLRTGMLSPLKLTFPTRKPVYPLKLSSANPQPFDLLIYLVLVRPADRYQYLKVDFERPFPIDAFDRNSRRPARREGWAKECPLLAGMAKGRAIDLYALAWTGKRRVRPASCTSDLSWPVSVHPLPPGCDGWETPPLGWAPY